MSVSRGSQDGLSYSDHEVQTIRHHVNNATGSTGSQGSTNSFAPVDDRGLDNNEVAELVAFAVNMRVITVEISTSQSERNHVAGEYEMGINNGTGPENTTSDQGLSFTENFDTPDVLHIMAVSDGAHAFREAADSLGGGGGGGGHAYEFRNLRAAYGSGPYLDADDDITQRIQIDALNSLHNEKLETYTMLWWDVHEIEDNRARYGPPRR